LRARTTMARITPHVDAYSVAIDQALRTSARAGATHEPCRARHTAAAAIFGIRGGIHAGARAIDGPRWTTLITANSVGTALPGVASNSTAAAVGRIGKRIRAACAASA